MTPQEYLQLRQMAGKLHHFIQQILAEADEAARAHPLPANLRPATAADVRVDSIMWYPKYEDYKWVIVDEVLCPGDPWKAYNGHDGCRHGLEGAFVEVE